MNLDDRLRDYLGGAGDGLDVTAAGADIAHQRARVRSRRQRRSANIAVVLMMIGASMIYLSQRSGPGAVTNATAIPDLEIAPAQAPSLDLDLRLDPNGTSQNERPDAPSSAAASTDSPTPSRGTTDSRVAPPWADLMNQPADLPRPSPPQPTPAPPAETTAPPNNPAAPQNSTPAPPATATAAANDTATTVMVDLRLPALNLQIQAASEADLGPPPVGSEWRTDIRQYAQGPGGILAMGSATLVRAADGTALSEDAVRPMIWLIDRQAGVTTLDHQGIGTAVFRTLVVEATDAGWRVVAVNEVDLGAGSRPSNTASDVSIYESPDGQTWSLAAEPSSG